MVGGVGGTAAGAKEARVGGSSVGPTIEDRSASGISAADWSSTGP